MLFPLLLLYSSANFNQVIIFLLIFLDVLCLLDYVSLIASCDAEHVKIEFAPNISSTTSISDLVVLFGPPHEINIAILALLLPHLIDPSLSTPRRSLTPPLLLLPLNLLIDLLIPPIVKLECFLGALHMVEVLEALVVDSELELVPVLHDVQLVAPDLEGVLERGTELLHLKDASAVPEHFLLSAEVTTH